MLKWQKAVAAVVLLVVVCGFVWYLSALNNDEVFAPPSSSSEETAVSESPVPGVPAAAVPTHGPCGLDKDKFCQDVKGRHLQSCLRARYDELSKSCARSLDQTSE